jgi:hypothetical protein
MQIGDLYIYNGKAYIVKSYHPNPKRVLMLNLATGDVFSVLKSIVRTGYTSSTQDYPCPTPKQANSIATTTTLTR